MAKCKLSKCIRNQGHTLVIVLCSIVGFGVGQTLRSLQVGDDVLRVIEIPSSMMMRSFTMLVVPLICCGIILGMSSMRKTGNDRIVGITLLFFVLLMSFSATFGCVLVQIFHPGHAINQPETENTTISSPNLASTPPPKSSEKIVATVMDFFTNAIPDNLITAAFMKRYTSIQIIPSTNNFTNGTAQRRRISETQFSANYTGLLVICILVGFAIAGVGEKAEPLRNLIEAVNSVMMKILEYLIKILPFGIFCWLCNQGIRTSDPMKAFSSMGYYLALYISAQATHQLIFLPLLYLLIVRRNPIKFYGNILQVVMTAFGCASSAATLPVTISCMEEGNKVHQTVTQFVLPLGVVLNMQGGAMGNPISTIFLAQMEGIETGIVHSIILCAVSVLFSMASPGIPSTGSPVSFLTSLNIIGIEKSYYVGMMMAVDWFTDRFRTTNNVVGDCYVAAYVEKLCLKPSMQPEVMKGSVENGDVEKQITTTEEDSKKTKLNDNN